MLASEHFPTNQALLSYLEEKILLFLPFNRSEEGTLSIFKPLGRKFYILFYVVV